MSYEMPDVRPLDSNRYNLPTGYVPHHDYRLSMPSVARDLIQKLSDAGFDEDVVQTMCLAEEVGEYVKAWRRAAGKARKTGSWEEVADELADVLIVAFINAEKDGIDLWAAVDQKLEKIYTRGWREVPADNDPGCVLCGRDNRNGTHDALKMTGHLNHDFTASKPRV